MAIDKLKNLWSGAGFCKAHINFDEKQAAAKKNSTAFAILMLAILWLVNGGRYFSG